MNIVISRLQKFKLSLNLIIISVFLLVSTFTLKAQEEIQVIPNRGKIISVAKEIIKAARYCALITIDSTGQPHVRTMDPFSPDTDRKSVV